MSWCVIHKQVQINVNIDRCYKQTLVEMNLNQNEPDDKWGNKQAVLYMTKSAKANTIVEE